MKHARPLPPWTCASRGSRHLCRHAQHDMIPIISSSGSSQVLCASLDTTMVLRVITPHDREGSEVSFHARYERAFLSREDEKDQKWSYLSLCLRHFGPRSGDRPLYACRGGLRGAGASSTDSKIAANIERGF